MNDTQIKYTKKLEARNIVDTRSFKGLQCLVDQIPIHICLISRLIRNSQFVLLKQTVICEN